MIWIWELFANNCGPQLGFGMTSHRFIYRFLLWVYFLWMIWDVSQVLASVMISYHLDLYSLRGRTPYRTIKVVRFGFRLFQSLWTWTGTSEAAPLSICLSNIKAMRSSNYALPRLRCFTRFGNMMSLVHKGLRQPLRFVVIFVPDGCATNTYFGNRHGKINALFLP